MSSPTRLGLDNTALPSAQAATVGLSTTRPIVPLALLACGLAALYLPSFHSLANSLWATDQNAHGPIVLAVAIWFIWRRLKQLNASTELIPAPAPLAGSLTLLSGLVLYVIGRSQGFHVFDMGSLIPVLAGLVLLLWGPQVLRRLWFGFFFLLFVIPLPGSIVDLLTQPMKLAVSWGAEHLLYLVGYPVARAGVMITIGPYQLLVADACAGLNSLFSLEALGLLYLNVTRHESVLRNVLLAILIVPISYTANLIRVCVLALITYHLGDAAGQGFLHGFSGLVLFLSALLLIIAVDGVLRRIAARLATRREASA